MKKAVKNKAIIWDYSLKAIDLKRPAAKVWFLSRKIRFGDLTGINKKELKKYLPRLEINASLKELLANFLYAHR
jgi:hypothetical protein